MSNKTPYRQRAELRKKAFAKALNHRMEHLALTPSELADKSGIPRDQISRYVNARTLPGAEYQERLAKALQCHRTDLFSIKGRVYPEGEYMSFSKGSDEGEVVLEVRKRVSVEQAQHIMQLLSGTGAAAYTMRQREGEPC